MNERPTVTRSRGVAAIVMALTAVAAAAGGQQAATAPRSSPFVPSMGQPPRWQQYVAVLGEIDQRHDDAGASFVLGVDRPLMNPVTGIVGASGELYSTSGTAWDGLGARLLARSPVLGLAAGADWNISSARVDFILSARAAVRRGGLVGGGSMLRVDWMPTRGQTLGVGVNVPLLQPFAGRTRPRRTGVRLPTPARVRSEPPWLLPAGSGLETAAGAADLIRVYTSLYSAADEMRLRNAPSHAAVTRSYHESLRRAFALASGDSVWGRLLSARARAGALEHVLLPYDALFGRVKDNDDIRGLTSRAHTLFARWVRDSTGVAAAARPAVVATHGAWMRVLEEVHRRISDEWGDSRAVWLPLRLALAPEEYDEQAEVDSLISRAVGRPFTDRNALTLLRSSDLPLEIARSIYATRDYHVLWMHDFAGRRERTRAIDNVSYEMVADVYLPALTRAVQRYDSAGRLPAFMIFLDQFFYEPRDGRLWMSILENPLGASIRLEGDTTPQREAHLRRRQAELRAAVAASRRLQQEAARAGGERWLRRAVKVHVSVVYPSDFSFRSHRIIPGIPLTPDNIMRDHRKIAFYDLTEADPYRGALFLMGVGIGEHYTSATWEDRGYRIRGPAAIEARAAARRLLRDNGFRDEDIPPPLREVTSAPAAEQRANLGDYVGRTLQVHNEVGFGAKESSVARALLYELALPGSIVVVPDPLWLSAEWGAMLAAAATRGARVHVIAPALANAPSPQKPLMALSHDVMSRLVQIRDRLGSRIRGAGGELRVGLFAAQAPVDDPGGRRREVREGLQRNPWIRDLIPFDARAIAVLDRAESRSSVDSDASAIARDERPRPPQLHQKTQVIARPGAIAALVRQPGWEDVIARSMEVQSRQTARFAEQLGYTTPNVDTAATRGADLLLRGYEQAIPEAERKNVSFYFALGTQNMDPRGMMLDGEATLLVSGVYAAAGLVDLYYVMARTTWVTTQAEIDRLLPPPSGLMRRIARLIRPAL